ncbi:hypothetical protein F3B47_10865 [Bacteroides fragilis]|uniref:Uncharacterized protein n=3 Tax=Bacteroidaceae TaxID=815 RepID=A0A6I1B943_PHOVU|nr:hypothetical protein F3B36_12190 [Bacteroides fragilis]KAB4189539.1 hypothetical protein GAP51_19150 [Bacteroides uniformis]KAB6594290.1 hypothetical protein GAZ81_13435 [Phocaeicola vulgatus]KAA4760794.1 hypothetical protein F3B47_10865 [Bacteroides fragilis]KAA4765997.1 hypothetical protein F3B25_09840 [Bacteroides fragilis]
MECFSSSHRNKRKPAFVGCSLCGHSLFYHSVLPLYKTKLFRFRLLPVRTCFFLCKSIATEKHSSTATLFEHNFSVAFPIFNRSNVAYAPYRNCKKSVQIPCLLFLKGNLECT